MAAVTSDATKQRTEQLDDAFARRLDDQRRLRRFHLAVKRRRGADRFGLQRHGPAGAGGAGRAASGGTASDDIRGGVRGPPSAITTSRITK